MSPASSAPSPEGEGAVRSTALAFAMQMTTSAFTAALAIYLVRALRPHGYGVFTLAIGVGGVLLLPSDFGLSHSVARFVAERRGDPAAVARVVAHGLRLKLGVGLLVTVALLATAGPIAATYGEPDLAWPIRWVSIAIFGQSLFLFYTGAFVALRRVAVSLRIVFGESLVEAVASVALVLAGAGAAGAALGRATGYAVGALGATVVTVRVLGRRSVAARGREAGTTGMIARYAGALLIVDSAFTAIGQMDTLLIGAVLGTTAVGRFGAVLRMLVFLTYGGLAAASGVAPRLAREAGGEPDVRSFAAAIRYLVLFQGVLIAPLVVWATPIVDLVLGPGYGVSATVMRALAPMAFAAGIAPLVSVGVNYLGEARRRVPIMLATLALCVVTTVVGLETIGLVGAAIADDLTFVVYVAAHVWICRRMVDLELRPLLGALLRALLAAGAMALVLAALGTSSLSPGEWVGGAAGGLAAYLAVLLATRALAPDELRAGLELVVGRLRPAR